MKNQVRVSLVQFAPAWLEPEKNALRMAELAAQEAQNGAELIIFPELANVGYITGCATPSGLNTDFAKRYVQAAESVPGPTTESLGEVAATHGVHIVVGLAERHPVIPHTLFNSAVLLGPSGIIGVHHKAHLPTHERHFFYPGGTSSVFPTPLGNIGLLICYDLRFPELARVLALKGAEIICVCWAGPGTDLADLQHIKYRTFTRAQENGCYVALCNRVGEEEDVRFIGRSVVAAPHGEILAYCDTDEETVLRSTITDEAIIQYRATRNVFRDRRPDLYTPITAPIDGGEPGHAGS